MIREPGMIRDLEWCDLEDLSLCSRVCGADYAVRNGFPTGWRRGNRAGHEPRGWTGVRRARGHQGVIRADDDALSRERRDDRAVTL